MLKRKTNLVNLTEPPGVPCPQCQAPIRLTIAKLLTGTPIFCSECGLQLTVDSEGSTAAMDAVKTVQRTMNDLERG
jgi:predicted amidophosphoribosyltransferase